MVSGMRTSLRRLQRGGRGLQFNGHIHLRELARAVPLSLGERKQAEGGGERGTRRIGTTNKRPGRVFLLFLCILRLCGCCCRRARVNHDNEAQKSRIPSLYERRERQGWKRRGCNRRGAFPDGRRRSRRLSTPSSFRPLRCGLSVRHRCLCPASFAPRATYPPSLLSPNNQSWPCRALA